jgi:hypothetical protein
MLLLVGHEVRREVAAVELHALDDLELVCEALGLLDGDDALLADLLHRVGQDLADLSSPLAEMVPTWAISFGSLVGLAMLLELGDDGLTAASMPRLSSIGLWPAATSLRAFTVDGLGEHRGGGGAVAGDVVGLGGDLAHHLGAHVLELVGLSSISLATVTPSLVVTRRAEALLEHDVAALGAEGDLDGVGEGVDAGEDALLRVRIKRICLAAMVIHSLLSREPRGCRPRA